MKPIVEVVRRTIIQSDNLADRITLFRAERRTGELIVQISQGGIRHVEFIERESLSVGEST